MGVGNGQNVMVDIIHLRNNLMTGVILSIPTLIFHCCYKRKLIPVTCNEIQDKKRMFHRVTDYLVSPDMFMRIDEIF